MAKKEKKDMFAWNKAIQEMQKEDGEWRWGDEETPAPVTGDFDELVRERLIKDDGFLMEMIEETIKQIEAERDLKTSVGFRTAQRLLDHIVWITEHKKAFL